MPSYPKLVLTAAAAILCLAPSTAAALGTPLPPEIKWVADKAKTLSAYYSQAKGAFEAGLALGEALGLIDTEDASEKLDRISDQLNTLAAGVDWKQSMAFIDAQRGPATRAIRSIQRIGFTWSGSIDDQDSGNAAETLRLSDVPFYRPYSKKATHDGVWNRVVEYTKDELLPQAGGSMVWDWRLGIPALLEVISYRLQVIAAIDPNFRRNSSYDGELDAYRSTLENHLDTMLTGVKCDLQSAAGTALGLGWICADIRTGIYAWRILGDWQGQTQEEIFSQLRGEVLRQMPVFEVRAMIDTLYLYQHEVYDLTELYGQIPVAAGPGLCLDVQWGSSDLGAPIWLWECNWTYAQWWEYDRRSGTVFNPGLGRCLDVRYGGTVLKTPVWSWECNGTDAQRWTYDFETGVLENALGNVLDIEWGNLMPQTPVWTWPRNGTAAQQWLAEQW